MPAKETYSIYRTTSINNESARDKASARRVAIEANVPVIPATEVLGDDMDDIKAQAAEIGYPLMLKARGWWWTRNVQSNIQMNWRIKS